MNSDIFSSSGDVVRAVLADLVSVALLDVTHHSLHTQLLHSLSRISFTSKSISIYLAYNARL